MLSVDSYCLKGFINFNSPLTSWGIPFLLSIIVVAYYQYFLFLCIDEMRIGIPFLCQFESPNAECSSVSSRTLLGHLKSLFSFQLCDSDPFSIPPQLLFLSLGLKSQLHIVLFLSLTLPTVPKVKVLHYSVKKNLSMARYLAN